MRRTLRPNDVAPRDLRAEFLLAYRCLVAGNSVHAIYAEGDLPPEFAKDTELNAVQAQQVEDLGPDAITAKKKALPGAEKRKNAKSVINFDTLFGTYNIYSLRLSQSRVRSGDCPNLVID